MKRQCIVNFVALVSAVTLWPLYAAAQAQNHNSSRSNRTEGISGGSADIISNGGTGILLEIFDANNVLIPTFETHQTTPSNIFNLASSSFNLPPAALLTGPVTGLWGIDPSSNVTGQTGLSA